MIVFLLLLLGTALSSHRCSFTVTSVDIFGDDPKLRIGSTCDDCQLIHSACYPSVRLRMYGTENPGYVVWAQEECNVLGYIHLTSLISEELFISVIPQECSLGYQPLHTKLHPFPTGVSTAHSFSDLDYTASLASPIHTTTGYLHPYPGSSESFILWLAGSDAVLVNFGDLPDGTSPDCAAELTDDIYHPIPVTGYSHLFLHNGLLFSPPDTLLSTPRCVRRVTRDVTHSSVYVISDTDTVYRVGENLADPEEVLVPGDIVGGGGGPSWECLQEGANSGANVTFRDVLGSRDMEMELFLLTFDSDLLYLRREGEEGWCYTFPSTVESVAELTLLSEVGSGGTAFQIDKFYSLQRFSPHVIGVGSVVIYSPCFGCVWYLTEVEHNPHSNYTVSLDNRGRYLIGAPSVLYSGYLGDISRLESAVSLSENDNLTTLTRIKDGDVERAHLAESPVGRFEMRRSVYDLEGAAEFNTDMATTEEILAGVFHNPIRVEVCVSHHPSFTRQSTFAFDQGTYYEEICEVSRMPEKVYLQYGDSYSVIVTFSLFTPRIEDIDYLEEQSTVSSNVWNGALIEEEITRTVDYRTLTVIHNITLTERGQSSKGSPGGNLSAVSVTLLPLHGASLAPLSLYLGCKDSQTVVLDLTESGALASSTEHVLRVQYDAPFRPVFKVLDLVSGEQSPYTGNFSLTIIGGGHSVDEMEPFSDTKIEDVNAGGTGGPRSVWLYNGNNYTWTCSEQSPCSAILPGVSEGVPSYCFNVSFSNIGMENEGTYCEFQREMTICVKGLPLSTWQSIVCLLVFLIIFLGYVCLIFIKKFGWQEFVMEVTCSEPQEEDADAARAAFLAKQAEIRRNTRRRATDRRTSILNDVQAIQRQSLTVPGAASRRSIVSRQSARLY